MKRDRYIVMLGTHFDTMGGISAVVNEYRQAGLFDRFPIVYLPTHADGSGLKKLGVCAIAWLRYMGLLLRGKIGLIHVHTASDASFWRKSLFLFPAFLARVPTILHLHGAEFSRFYARDCNRMGKWAVRYVFDHADSVVVLSETWARWVRTVSPQARIRPINNPVRLPSATDFAMRESSTILFLGRLGERKGTYDLLRAVSRLTHAYPHLKLSLGGDGELDRVRDEAIRLGIGKQVELLGWVSGADKAALLKRSAVYALPSYAEGLPMSVLEAMAAGLPVVSTPVGGIPEVVTDGGEGYLTAPGDVEALAAALERLLADDNLRQRMGRAARAKAETVFATERVLPKVETLYRELGFPA